MGIPLLMYTSSAYSLDSHMYATASSRARARIYARAYIEQHDSMGGMHQLRGVREDPKREREGGSGDHQEERDRMDSSHGSMDG
jgi:hypothetical protein